MRLRDSNLPRVCSLGGHSLRRVDWVSASFLYNLNLDFSAHIKLPYNKASTRTYTIFKGLSRCGEKVLIKAYKTYIRPVMECSSSMFYPLKRRDVRLLEKAQNKFTTKVMLRLKKPGFCRIPGFQHRNSRFQLHTLQLGRKLSDVCAVFRILLELLKVEDSKFWKNF